MISTRSTKRGTIEIYPKFIIRNSSDLMIRGRDFYAVWLEEYGLWSTDEQDALQLIDRELDSYAKENSEKFDGSVRVLHMWDASTGMIDIWHKYCQKQMRDNFHMLDEKLIFSNETTTKQDYASKKLPYPLEDGSITAYEKIISTLYSQEERMKIEWAIGSIVTGDSKKLQKFVVLYGEAGTGKSTILNIIQMLFDGYYSVFDSKALGSASNSFALEAFKSNPLVAIEHDGDLSRIEDNTRINSLVSHELMTVNEKFKSTYTNRFKSFLFMGTNRPVKITDAKSGLLRRLIDITPSGNKLSLDEYNEAIRNVSFELGAIAYHCKQVYLDNKNIYNNYIPIKMLSASNDFYNFVLDSYLIFEKENGTTMKTAWLMYKQYCEEAKVSYPFSQRIFKEELKNYFKVYHERYRADDGTRIRNYYQDFRKERFEDINIKPIEEIKSNKIKLDSSVSIFDELYSNCLAQYATAKETPYKAWDKVRTKLSDIDTSKLHYVKIPEEENHIVIDFDIKDEKGNKCLEKNLEAASKFPPTYTEVSKGGKGLHLHYIYIGDTSILSRIYGEDIEIKVFNGNSSLRRRLTKCNSLPIAKISSGLPMKGENKVVNSKTIEDEKHLRNLIKKCLNKEIHSATKPSIDFIFKLLEDAYESGIHYDVSDMANSVLVFAANSTNNADYCIKRFNNMSFKSKDTSIGVENNSEVLIFYDIEVFPNLFLVNWKKQGKDKTVVRMINPKPKDVEELLKLNLVGFNCRRYDNHLLFARAMGYTNEQLYKLSQKIISGERNCFFGEAYNVSYTDVYDFCSKKQSLKKWEIELGIHHQELGLPWNEPVPENLWMKVAEYCDNDVLATEAVFEARQADFEARKVLAKIAGGTVNDTTNTLTTRLIFGNNRHPQDQFIYTDLRKEFPGYEFKDGVSTYRGEETGEGGRVYAEPGIYEHVALLDIASMHPHSAIALNIFGDEYTIRFKDLVDARIAIKHKDMDTLKVIFDGAFAEFINATDEELSNLATALKIAINSVYGLTSAKFDNPFRDPRNVDNIIAKRGALFMINLQHEVQERGFTVAHIKTDSIKIPNATPEIIQFVMDYGKKYGYSFEHEDTYARMCLVNDAVYIAKYENPHIDKKTGTEIWWTATGKQFQVPYVFKSLFSKEPITFKDMCETFSVTSSLYLDMNEKLPNVEAYERLRDVRHKMVMGKKVTKKDEKFHLENGNITDKDLNELISEGHKYRFVGKVGQFCPIKKDCGGGLLLREKDGKYYAATGTTGYRWLESEMVQKLGKEEFIDTGYYEKMVNDAIDSISKHGDFEWFVSED